MLPVIFRELRAQARQPLTYWLRLIGGFAVAAAVALALVSMGTWGTFQDRLGGGAGLPNPVQTFGTTLFGKMNLFIFLSIWIFVPLATADAVSRERREGTLPLLYLTELRSFGIVVGKAFVHLLRSTSLFLTMAPWLMLPVVFGGVGVRDIGMALMLDTASVFLAQAAGLLASTFPRDWLKSVIMAEVIALILLVALLKVHGGILREAMRIGAPGAVAAATGRAVWWRSGFALFWDFYEPRPGLGMIAETGRLLELITNGPFGRQENRYMFGPGANETDWQQMWAHLAASGHRVWFRYVAATVVGSWMVLLAATWIGAWRVRRSWQDASPRFLTSDLGRKVFATRFGVRSLSRRLSKSLTANPIGWLEQYSPSARLVKWAWCLFIILVEVAFSGNEVDLYAAQAGLGWLLLLGLAFSATGSFRNELETGAFELLLVTPLREHQIITGRVRGLWRQFLPAMVVYGAGSIYLASGWSDHDRADRAWLALARTMSGFFALPLIGLYFSVQRWNFFAAWLVACLIGLFPVTLGRTLGATEMSMIILQLSLGLGAAALLLRRLQNREFLQQRG